MSSHIEFRPAVAADTEFVLPLIHSAGPQAIDYGFGLSHRDARDFLRAAFFDGPGFFGWRNHVVALVQGEVVAVSATYSLPAYLQLSLQHAAQVWRHYPLAAFPGVMRRGMQLQTLMPPPGPSMHYLANFGVREDLRGRGIGLAMLEHHVACARRAGRTVFALDVSVQNPRAQAFYARFGMQIRRTNKFGGPAGAVPDTRRMEMPL